MPETVPPPIDDPLADVPKQSPPLGGWDTEQLIFELMREDGCSYPDAEQQLARLRSEYSLGQIRALLDRRIVGQ